MQLLTALSPPPPELIAFLGVGYKGAEASSSASLHGRGGLQRRAGGGVRAGGAEGASSGGNGPLGESAARGAESRRPGVDEADYAATSGGASASSSSAAAASSSAAARSSAALVAGACAGLAAFALRLWHGGRPLLDPTRLFSANSSFLSSGDGASSGWLACVAVLTVWGLLYRALLRYG